MNNRIIKGFRYLIKGERETYSVLTPTQYIFRKYPLEISWEVIQA
jgi:hypothetical protein